MGKRRNNGPLHKGDRRRHCFPLALTAMIFTLPIPFFVLIVFWRLCGAELIGLPTTRRSCMDTLLSRGILFFLSVVYGIGLILCVADMNAP